MLVSKDLVPTSVLTELGRIATIWSVIEQEILIHTSALASQYTDGWPTDNLHMPFQKLRARWYKLACDAKLNQKILTPLNMKLARYADERNAMLHGKWTKATPRRYLCRYWKQTGNLKLYKRFYKIQGMRLFTTKLRALLSDLRTFN